MSEQWYYAEGTEQRGPVTEDTLLQMLRAGQLTASHLAWRPGMAEWLPISAIAEVAWEVPGGPPPLTQVAYAAPQQINYFNPAQTTVVYAGFWLRVGAYIIDYLVLLVPNQVISGAMQFVIAAPLRGAGRRGPWAMLPIMLSMMTILTCIDWLYYALMESSPKQGTLGKMACGIVVTDLEGKRISFGRATGRYFGKLLSSLILCIGYMMAGWTAKKQALHDELAKTLVVRKQLPQGAL